MSDLPYDFHVVAIDESYAWTKMDDYRYDYGVERICGVYLIDVNLRVHICSLSPSVEALFIENLPFFTAEATDEQREAFYDHELHEAVQEEAYAYFSGTGRELIEKSAVDSAKLDLDEQIVKRIEALVGEGDPYDPVIRAQVFDEVMMWYVPNPIL